MSGAGETAPRRHPDNAVLLLHGAGRLGRPFRAAVAAHAAHCGRCRRVLAAGAAAGGWLLDEAPPTPLAPGALGAALARLDEPAPPPPPARVPLSIRTWPVAPGVRHRQLLRDGRESLHLFRVRPGCSLPVHHHVGPELTCVLEGAYVDETGLHVAGDAASAATGGPHDVRAAGEGPCVCLLAITGRLRFATPIPRAMQRLLGL